MKLVYVLLPWILLLIVIKEVYGEPESVFIRYKRDHQAEDIDSSENVTSTEIKDGESLTTTNNDEQNTTCTLKVLPTDFSHKKIPKRRKSKRLKCKKNNSIVSINADIEKFVDDDSKTTVVEKSNSEGKQDEIPCNQSLVDTEKEEKEEISQSEEIETECSDYDRSLLNSEPEASLRSENKCNQQDAKKRDTINVENEPKSLNNNEEKNNKGSTVEIETKAISDETKSEKSMKEKECCDSLPSKQLENKLNNNEDIKETKVKNTADRNENDMNISRNNEPQEKELIKKVKSLDTTQVLHQIPSGKPNNIQELFTCNKQSNVVNDCGKEKDLKSNICTSSEKINENNQYSDSEKQGLTLGYEQENLQHSIRRYYIYPPLSKSSQTNYFVDDQQMSPQFNTIDLIDNPYGKNPDHFFYKTPNFGYIDDYEVQDANGHKIPYTKSRCFNGKRNILMNNAQIPRKANQEQIYNSPYNSNVNCNQFKKTTNIPNFKEYAVIENTINQDETTGYIPRCNKPNYGAISDIQYIERANPNYYIPKTNENQNFYNNAITNNNKYNDYKCTNGKSFNKELFSKIDQNYSQLNREDINGLTITENIDRQISRDIQTEQFRSIEEETWKSRGNRKLLLNNCNKTN